MVKCNSQLDLTFAALAHPTRRAILGRLAAGETSAGELAQPFDMSWPAVSKHLRVLERAGLVSQDKQGRVRRCKLQAGDMRQAAEWIDTYKKFWTDQLDALATFLEQPEDSSIEDNNPIKQGE